MKEMPKRCNDTALAGQVQLSKLIFTHNWEDAAIDEKVLKIKSSDTVFTITSGGCNSLGFLRFNPASIYCVDINPAQNYLMELKKAAFKELDYETCMAFFGLNKCKERKKIFALLQKYLSQDASDFWYKQREVIAKGIIMNGRYEQFVKIAGSLLRLLQGRRKVKTFFTLSSIEEQKKFYEERWDNKRWRWIFNTMFNKKRLAKKGLVNDYFQFDDGSSSFSESFYKRASHVMKDIAVESNYFIALYFLGHYLNRQNVPEYLREENFSAIKSNIDKIQPVSADSKYWLERQPANMFDAFALSNICELMDDKDTHKLFSEVIRTAKPDARIIFRNLMIPREAPEDLRCSIIKDELLSRQIQFEDRSFVYGKVAAYKVNKD
jgi:S-adenosylmethionine-diacylglycerol 3-amino-3-carboxypropyl transferase